MSDAMRRVGAVVLTYNSVDDLADCLACLKTQRGVDLTVIVVDNASQAQALATLEADFQTAFPDSPVLEVGAVAGEVENTPAVFLRNHANNGYSAGNNIGAMLAAELGCETILIVNPDVRIDNPDYVAGLADLVTADPKTAVACSALRSLSGAHENPMTEPGYIEELLWPVRMITARLWRARGGPQPPTATALVDKVSGACFMIRTDCLREIGFFDESVFLYCEESILRAQVRVRGWHMLMEPGLDALHAHRSSDKGSPLPRFRFWAQSRRRFHRDYSGYGALQQALLSGSRAMMMGLVGGSETLRRIRNGILSRRIEREG